MIISIFNKLYSQLKCDQHKRLILHSQTSTGIKFINQSINHSFSQSIDRLVSPSIRQLVSQSIN